MGTRITKWTQGILLGWSKCSKTRSQWWLHNFVNLLKSIIHLKRVNFYMQLHLSKIVFKKKCWWTQSFLWISFLWPQGLYLLYCWEEVTFKSISFRNTSAPYYLLNESGSKKCDYIKQSITICKVFITMSTIWYLSNFSKDAMDSDDFPMIVSQETLQ